MKEPTEFNFDDDYPDAKGWYAVTICYDSMEGLIPGSAYWTGKEWGNQPPIVCFAGPFENSTLAKEWAYDHDIESY